MKWLRKKFWLALAHLFHWTGWTAGEEFCNSRYCAAIGCDPDVWKYL